MKDRRHHPRHSVSWRARLWPDECVATSARVVDASVHGMRVGISHGVPLARLRRGESYRVQIGDEGNGEFLCLAEVRHVGDRGVGLETRQVLPLAPATPE